MMRDLIETQFDCEILAWDEPKDDLGWREFRALKAGRLIVADSLALLISALQDEEHIPLMLLAA